MLLVKHMNIVVIVNQIFSVYKKLILLFKLVI